MLNLDNLKNNKDKILKAEIVSYLALWDKVNPDANPNKYVGISLNKKNLEDWKDLIKNYSISIFNKNFNLWDDFLNNWRNWKGQTDGQKILQILYGIGESLNSGIDKGSPKKEVKVEPHPWLANAFGSFRSNIIYLNGSREELNNAINSIENKLKNLLDFLDTSNNDGLLDELLIKKRKMIIFKIKTLLNNLLSDDRFPINDITLWDQTYMATSMFKALLAEYVLTPNNFSGTPNRNEIKWRILGIQYDKLGLVEKGLKIATITWYRETTKKIDDKIKELLEVKYPIGNEIYRDETGIYFLVGERLGKDLNDGSNLAVLKEELIEIEEKIYKIFEDELKDELYPAIFLTKPSRGLMNIGYLIEKAKENFLKSKIKKKNLNLCLLDSIKGNAIGVCPVCRVRLIYEKDKEKRNKPTICEVCDDRIHHKRVKDWLENIEDETIWIDELKDKNNRIALITLKFELEDWLNGNLLNSLLINNLEYEKILLDMKLSIIDEVNMVSRLKEDILNYVEVDINKLINDLKNIEKIEYEDLKGKVSNKKIGNIMGRYNNIRNFGYYQEVQIYLNQLKNDIGSITTNDFFTAIVEIRNILLDKENKLKNMKDKINGIIMKLDDLKQYKNIDKIKKLLEIFEPYHQKLCELNNLLKKGKQDSLPEFEKILTNYVPFIFSKQIINYFYHYNTLKEYYQTIFFNSIIGTEWEEFIKETPLNSKIDWENERIKWDEFTDENDPALEILSILLLQFLLRKNPSPARLRRIWETTKEFVEDIKNNLINDLEIPEWRKRRLVFEVSKNDINGELKETGEELEGNRLLFWTQPNGDKVKIYLISSIEEFIERFKKRSENKKGNEEILKNIYKSLEDEKGNEFKNNMVDFEIKLEKEINGEKKIVTTLKKDNLIEIQPYKPFASIIDPTPISWQFIIPAEYVPKLIKKIQNEYYKNFKWVYGKLPLHIGIIIQHYKSPLYIGINALRKIRRDLASNEIDELFNSENNLKKIEEAEKIFKEIIINEIYQNKNTNDEKLYKKLKNHFNDKRLKEIFDEIRNRKVIEIEGENFEIPDGLYYEIKNKTEKYYTLYWSKENIQNSNSYIFYIKPKDNWKKELCLLTKLNKGNKIICFPNTFDFEILDSNVRRNDIEYYKGKRVLPLKSNRPYNLEDWKKFIKFKEIFENRPSKLQKLINIIYKCLEDWDNKYDDSISQFLAISFINVLELNKKSNEDVIEKLCEIFEISLEDKDLEKFRNELINKIDKDKMQMFIDMFEFWHKGLKAV